MRRRRAGGSTRDRHRTAREYLAALRELYVRYDYVGKHSGRGAGEAGRGGHAMRTQGAAGHELYAAYVPSGLWFSQPGTPAQHSG